MEYPIGLSIIELKKRAYMARKHIIKMIYLAGSGHPGGSLSAIDILVALYYNFLRHRSDEPDWNERDRFILSKGHICPALYTVLAMTGYFPVEELKTFRKIDSNLQGHPHMLKTAGIEVSSGSLGQGLSIANGIAMSLKYDKNSAYVYCMVGDGEMDEGQIWEAISTAGHYKLDNVIMIVDFNGLQIDGKVDEVKNKNPLKKRLESFNWEVIEIAGHNLKEIIDGFKKVNSVKNKPVAIIAKTIKGKGISFMENKVQWHGRAPNEEEFKKAMAELESGEEHLDAI
jgi:transketolase